MTAEPVARTFDLASGRVAAEVGGAGGAPLVAGIPGLSANLRSFDAIFAALDPARHRTLAFDPRGRGQSQKTPPGSYGWPAHARDVLEMATLLGAEKFDVVGWSMGAWIAMVVAQLAPERVRRLVLIDACGWPEETAVVPIYAGLDRLMAVYPSYDAFATLARSVGVYDPWEPWDRLFRYEFEAVDGGVRARTQKEAPWEDDQYRLRQDPYALWPAVTMPSLLVRASRPIPPDFGHILSRADYDRFLAEVPGARGVEIDANHYTVGMHPDTARAIAEFLDA